MQRTIKVISMFAMLFALASFAFGQDTVGSIEITTKDSAGALVPGVAVTVTSGAGTAGFRRTVTTDSSGFVRIPQVPPGAYKLSAAATAGFAESSVNARVELGKAAQVTVEMGVQVGEQVNVIGGDAPLDVTGSEISTSVNSEKIQSLPKGNSFTSILKVVPGTRPEGLAGGISIDGASGAENSFVIDGLEVTNYRNAGLNSNNDIPFALVQEVQVKSSGFNAEYGGATGGVISVVTKGGNNDFHGDFGMQFEPSKLQGANRPTLYRPGAGTAGNANRVEYYTSPKTDGNNFFPSANLSGRIIKDRLWFFGSWSPQIYDASVDTTFYNVGNAANNFTRTSVGTEQFRRKRTYEYGFGRLDASPFSNLRLTGTYLWNPQIDEGALPYGTVANGATTQSQCFDYQGSIGRLCNNELTSRQGGRQSSNAVTFQAVYTPTSNLVGTFRYSRGFLNEKIGNYFKVAGTVRYICVSNTDPAGFANSCTVGNNDPVNDYSEKDVSVRTNYEGDLSYLFALGGRHELKGGFSRSTIFNDLKKNDTTRIYLEYGFLIDNDWNWTNGAAPTEGAIGHGDLYRYSERGQGSNLNQAFYIQDKWQYGRLVLNLGVRIEKEDLPSFNEFDAPFGFGWGDKIAPRIGGAFDLFGNGKSKIFASYGKFYDRLKFKMAQGSFGGNFYRVDFFEIFPDSGPFRTAFTPQTILGNWNDAIGGACSATGFIGSGLSRCQNDYRVASNSPGADIEVAGGIDTDLNPYQQREFTVGFEHELSRNFVLKTRFTNKKLLETVEDAGAISSSGSEVYITGNPGRGLHAQFLEDFGYNAPYASARREYNAFEIQLDRRFADSYFFNVNYTYSRLRGNYSGLANSDEAGRSDPGVNRSFDLPMIGFTADGVSDYGPLATDRPHVVNAYGSYVKDWNGSNSTEFSAFQTFQSGTPQSTTIDFIVPIFFTKRGDRGRSPMFSQTDFSVQHKYKFGRDNRYSVSANVNFINLFDQKTVTGYYNDLSNASLLSNGTSVNNFGCPLVGPVGEEHIDYPCVINKFNAGTLSSALNGLINLPNGKDARYGSESSYQGGRGVRFGFRFAF